MKVFTINPGSTSTKVALFEGDECTFSVNVGHSAIDLAQFTSLGEQLPFRERAILEQLDEAGVSLEGLDAVVGRGGGLVSMEGGVYVVNNLVLDHSITCKNGVIHPASLGPTLAHRFAERFGGAAFVVNPPDVDEYQDVARLTGIKDVYRSSHIHSLNQKEVGRRHALALGKRYDECNFIIGHLGGGLSVAAHRHGHMIDGNDIVAGEGPMAPTRCGAIPADGLIRLCFSGAYTERELLSMCTRNGGFVDLLGTSDAREVRQRADDGDALAQLVWDTMAYQICKQIGAMASVLKGEVDAILLSGGMVYERRLVEAIEDACGYIAPITAYPGEFEMEAMAAGAVQVLTGEVEAKTYTGVPAWTPEDLAS